MIKLNSMGDIISPEETVIQYMRPLYVALESIQSGDIVISKVSKNLILIKANFETSYSTFTDSLKTDGSDGLIEVWRLGLSNK